MRHGRSASATTQSGANYGRAYGCLPCPEVQVLLYAASPLSRMVVLQTAIPGSTRLSLIRQRPTRWAKAADAAQAVININAYKLFVDSIPDGWDMDLCTCSCSGSTRIHFRQLMAE